MSSEDTAMRPASATYIQHAVDELHRELPDVDLALGRLYTLLALTKGTATTMADVHDAWALWQAITRPNHRSIIPYAALAPEVQELDRPYMQAIHRVAETFGSDTGQQATARLEVMHLPGEAFALVVSNWRGEPFGTPHRASLAEAVGARTVLVFNEPMEVA